MKLHSLLILLSFWTPAFGWYPDGCPASCYCPGSPPDDHLTVVCRDLDHADLHWPPMTRHIKAHFARTYTGDIPTGFVYGLQNLASIHISGNLGVIQPKAFYKISGSKNSTLWFSDARIQEIGSRAFTEVHNFDIQFLGTKVGVIQDEAFSNMTGTPRLFFHVASIQSIKHSAFSGLAGNTQTVLDIALTNINTTESNAFSGIHDIRQISVRGVNFEKISPWAFSDLHHIHDVDINSCLIKKVQSEAFSGLEHITFQFRHTKVVCMSSKAFTNFSYILPDDFNFVNREYENCFPLTPKIGLNSSIPANVTCGNTCKALETTTNCPDTCEQCDGPSIVCTSLPTNGLPRHVQNITLHMRKVPNLDLSAGVFSELPDLRFVTISGRVGTIHPFAFNITAGCEEIRITDARISNIEPGAFASSGVLKTIDIDHSFIGNIKPRAFSNINAEKLALASNQVNHISKDAFSGLTDSSKPSVAFHQNDIECLERSALDGLFYNLPFSKIKANNWLPHFSTSSKTLDIVVCTSNSTQETTEAGPDPDVLHQTLIVGVAVGLIALAILIIILEIKFVGKPCKSKKKQAEKKSKLTKSISNNSRCGLPILRRRNTYASSFVTLPSVSFGSGSLASTVTMVDTSPEDLKMQSTHAGSPPRPSLRPPSTLMVQNPAHIPSPTLSRRDSSRKPGADSPAPPPLRDNSFRSPLGKNRQGSGRRPGAEDPEPPPLRDNSFRSPLRNNKQGGGRRPNNAEGPEPPPLRKEGNSLQQASKVDGAENEYLIVLDGTEKDKRQVNDEKNKGRHQLDDKPGSKDTESKKEENQYLVLMEDTKEQDQNKPKTETVVENVYLQAVQGSGQSACSKVTENPKEAQTYLEVLPDEEEPVAKANTQDHPYELDPTGTTYLNLNNALEQKDVEGHKGTSGDHVYATCDENNERADNKDMGSKVSEYSEVQ